MWVHAYSFKSDDGAFAQSDDGAVAELRRWSILMLKIWYHMNDVQDVRVA